LLEFLTLASYRERTQMSLYKEEGIDLLELEKSLSEVFDKSSSRGKSANYGDSSDYARAAAELANAIINVRQQRFHEESKDKKKTIPLPNRKNS